LIEGSPQLGASVPAQTTIGTTAALALLANPKRKSLMIQNTGTTVLKFVLGETDPTQTVYTFALKGGTAANDALGGVYLDDAWVGPVRVVSSIAGGTYVLTELVSGNPDWDQATDWGKR
jgi:hypothetical protein